MTTPELHSTVSSLSLSGKYFFLTNDIMMSDTFFSSSGSSSSEAEYLRNGILEYRLVTISPRDSISELSLGSDCCSLEDDWLFTFTRPMDPKICTIRVDKAVDVGLDFCICIANNNMVVDLMDEQVLEFCSALTEYDESWIFHIRPSGTAMALVVTASTVQETLRHLLSTQHCV